MRPSHHRDIDDPDGVTGDLEFAEVAGDSAAVAGWTIVSRVTGFGRVVAIAAVLGPTYFGNLFQTANLLPNLAYELITGSLITALLVPPLVRRIDERRRLDTERLAQGFLGLVLVAFGLVVVLTLVAAPLLLRILTVVVADPEVGREQRRVGWPLLALLMPQVVFYGVAATGVAVQNAHRRFALAAAAPALENIGVIAVMASAGVIFGVGVGFDQVTPPFLLFIGLGTTGAVGLHAAAQWWGARRVGVTLLPRAGWRDPELRHVVRLAIPSVGFAALNAVRLFGLLIVAGSIPGGVVAFQVGQNFFNLPVAIGAKPVAAAQLPRLSRSFNLNRLRRLHADYRRGVVLSMFVAVPAALFFAGMARPLARAVAFGEMASTAGVDMVTLAIMALAGGILGESLFVVATSASYATRDARSPLFAMVGRTLLTVAGMLATLWFADGIAVLVGLGITVTVADGLGALDLRRRLEVRLPPGDESLLRPITTQLIVAAVTIGPVALLINAGGPWGQGMLGDIAPALVAGVATVGAYTLIHRYLGSPELTFLLDGVRGRAPGRPGSGDADPGPLGPGAEDKPGGREGGHIEVRLGLVAFFGAILLGAMAAVGGVLALAGGLMAAMVAVLARRGFDHWTLTLANRDGKEPGGIDEVSGGLPDPLYWSGRRAPTATVAVGRGPIGLRLAVAAVLGTGLLGATAAAGGPVVPLALAAMSLVALVVVRPQVGAYLYLALTPLVVGIERGTLLPGIRLNEALLVLLLGAMGVRWILGIVRGHARSFGVTYVDLAVFGLAMAGSVLPILWRFGRGLSISTDDVQFSVGMWKWALLFFLFRRMVTTTSQVVTCLWISMAAASIVAVVAVLQALSLFGVPDLLAGPVLFGDPEFLNINRGSATFGNAIAVGDFMAIHLAVALSMLAMHPRRPRLLMTAAIVFAFGGLASGQFSGVIALSLAFLTVGYVSGRLGMMVIRAVPVVMVLGAALWPVIARRLGGFGGSSGFPPSWVARLDNLRHFFWSELFSNNNWLLGVRPAGRLPAPETWRQWVFIESGYTWLLWVGGIPMVVAFGFFVWWATRHVVGVAKGRADGVGVAGTGALAGLVVITVLMLFDPHLTMRGVADVFFPLLALSMLASPSGGAAPPDAMVLASAPGGTQSGTEAWIAPPSGWRPPGAAYLIAKRLLDVVCSFVALVLLAPLMVLIACVVRLTSRGPALFAQERVGKGGRRFVLLKFRSMRVGSDDLIHRNYVTQLLREAAPSHGGSVGVFKLTNDPRLTRVGALIRRLSLDELPQLINVLAGEMTLVGPRPALAWEVEQYQPGHLARFLVKPGVTGLWQVRGRSSLGMKEALDLDVQYVRTASLTTDLAILLRTPGAVLRSSQAR